MALLHLLEHDPLDYPDTNITRWAARKGHRLRTANLHRGDRPLEPAEFDWLLVMGGSQHAWEEDLYPWLAPEKEYIRKVLAAGKPVLGICFGSQLLAEALGARVFPNGFKEIGWYEVTLTEEGRETVVCAGLPDRFATFHWHSDHFDLPPGCTRLAASLASPNQAFALEGGPAVGLQFHPEYTREMIVGFAEEYGHEWQPDRFVSDREAVLARTAGLPDTGWLMDALLDNLWELWG
ncbi:MAG: type 1 glutamine amidotransferase [Thermodesulfobacteriota bacterium]